MTDPFDEVSGQLVAFLPNMRRFAVSLTGSRDRADDLVQGACERALAGADRFAPGTRFDAWMFRIIRNLWIDRLRRERTAGPTEDVSEREDIVGVHGLEEAETRLTFKAVMAAMADLPDEQREVLVLTCVEDLSYREVAEIVGTPIGTVMSRLARARKRLADSVGINADAARSSDRQHGTG